MRKILLLIVLSIFATAQFCYAQRILPANAKRGVTGEPRPLPIVVVNGEAVKFGPGGVIFDTDNRTILHQSLPTNADVLFQLDMNGDIQLMYILTPDERARLDQVKR